MQRACMAVIIVLATTSVADAQYERWAGRGPWSADRGDWHVEIPFQVFDNVYYVGTDHVSSYLITTPGGLVLIDATSAETVDALLDNVRQLGFDPEEIEYVFITHPHNDHYGGAVRIKELTGATICMSGTGLGVPGAAGAQRGAMGIPVDHERRAADGPRESRTAR